MFWMFLAELGVEDENGGTSMANVNRNGRKLETLGKLVFGFWM